MTLETDRLILRRWRERDQEPFARLNADPRVMEYFPSVLSRADSDAMIRRIEEAFDRNGFSFWATELKRTGELIGFIGLNTPAYPLPFSPCVEVGWRLAHEHWGQGYAQEGARAALKYGFGPLGLGEIVSFTAAGNLRSRSVMERIGMSRDERGDFDHPRVPDGHPLKRHVLYRLQRGNDPV